MSPDELSERLLDFAVRVGKVVDALPNTRLGRHIAGQLVRCGTVRSGLLSQKKMGGLLDESEQLCRIIGQSVATAKRSRSRQP